MNLLYEQAQNSGVLRALDVQFARMITGDDMAGRDQSALMLAAACLSAEAGSGHVCLHLEQLQPDILFDGRFPTLASALWQSAGEPDTEGWLALLGQHPSVSDGTRPAPLVLNEHRLYLQRMWQSEGEVAAFFNTGQSVDSS